MTFEINPTAITFREIIANLTLLCFEIGSIMIDCQVLLRTNQTCFYCGLANIDQAVRSPKRFLPLEERPRCLLASGGSNEEEFTGTLDGTNILRSEYILMFTATR